MTLEQANWVRKLRDEKEYTWRAIAQVWCETWPKETVAGWDEPVSGNQLFGMDLCKEAEKILNDVSPESPEVE